MYKRQPLGVGSPLNQPGGLGKRCKRAAAKNEFGALESYEKATGVNHFEYSEVHVLQLSLIRSTVTASVRRPMEPARPPVNPPRVSVEPEMRYSK